MLRFAFFLKYKKPKTPSGPVKKTCHVRQKRVTTFYLCKFPRVLTNVAVDTVVSYAAVFSGFTQRVV